MTSKELVRARDQGAVIREAGGCEVGYFPRGKGDRLPWLMKGWPNEPRYRRSASNCRAEGRNGGPWAVASLLRF